MFRKFRLTILFTSFLLIGLAVAQASSINAAMLDDVANAPQIEDIRVVSVTPNVPANQTITVEKYAKFEIAFDIPNRNFETETNPYFPYGLDLSSLHVDKPGISVDLLLLSPTVTVVPDTDNGWDTAAKLVPCFYYQPVDSNLQPEDSAHWRCRLSADVTDVGNAWKYRVRVVDGGGRSYEPASPLTSYSFLTIPSNRKGHVRIQTQNGMTTKYFEFSDGTPFTYLLTNIEFGNVLNHITPADFESAVRQLSERGHHFVRWFPTDQGANYYVIPYAGDIKPSWEFSGGIDTAVADQGVFSYKLAPNQTAQQRFLALADREFLMTVRVNISGTRTLRAVISDLENPIVVGQTNGWITKTQVFVNNTTAIRKVSLNVTEGSGDVRVGLIRLQQRAKGSNDAWSPNLLTRGDPNTHEYVDQVAAARLDKILELSEQYNIYHKLPLFNKEDGVLARIQPNGALGPVTLDNFYSAGVSRRLQQEVYTRYFIARWSYSPAIHSLELANENDPRICIEDRNGADPASKPCTFTKSADAAYSFAEFVLARSTRKILMSNSFWADWSYAQILKFWNDPIKGPLMDYADIHWYGCDRSNLGDAACKGNSHSLVTWKDSAAYTLECRDYFRDDIANAQRPSGDNYWPLYKNRPILRGEGGVWKPKPNTNMDPIHPDYYDQTKHSVYSHKKLWSQVGIVTYMCDGEWYTNIDRQWPDYQPYQRFMDNEPVTNGNYQEIYFYSDYWSLKRGLKTNRITASGQTTETLRVVGLQETTSGRTLLWIDNSSQTWQYVNGGIDKPVSSTVIVSGFLEGGFYKIERWGTSTGAPAVEQPDPSPYFSSDGTIQIPVENLTTDFAVKIVPVPLGKATITIVKDALPDSPRNFLFHGPWGDFYLDDPGEDDGDSVKNSITFTDVTAPGTYSFSEDKVANWFFDSVLCSSSASVMIDQLQRSVTIIPQPDQKIICTFVNKYASSLTVLPYWDIDQDGQHDPTEDWQNGWWTEFYDSSGTLKASNFTQNGGHWDLYNIRPGTYTVCQKPQEGWNNTKPIITDPAHKNWPCYTFDLSYAQVAKAYFGYSDQPFVANADEQSAQSGLEIIQVSDPEQDALATWEEFLAVHPGDRLPDEDEAKTNIYLPVIER